ACAHAVRKPHVSRQCTPVRLFGRRIQPVCEFATIERHWPPSTKGQQSCSRNALIEKSRQVRLASPVAMSFWNLKTQPLPPNPISRCRTRYGYGTTEIRRYDTVRGSLEARTVSIYQSI